MTEVTEQPELLVDVLAEVVAADPDARLAIDTYEGERDVTRGELWRRVVTLSGELAHRGVGLGDCVGVHLPNWSDSLVWQFAADALGAHVIGINTRYGVGDIAHVLERARPMVVAVAHDFRGLDLGGRLRAALAEAGVPAPSVAVVAGPGRDRTPHGEAAAYDLGGGAWVPAEAHDASYERSALPVVADHLAAAFTTSGSTGKPKLAAHLSSNIATHARAVSAAGDFGPDAVTLATLPLSGVFAFNPAMATVAGGGTILLEPSFEATATLERMARHGVTHLASADDITGLLMAAWRETPHDLSAFRRMLIGDFYGDSLKVAEWLEHEIGTVVAGVFGSSELFALTSFWHPEDPAPARWGGGGRLVSDGIEVRAVDTSGDVVGPGESGELQFRGYHTVDAYLGDTDGSTMRAAFTEDGWFRSGDLGTVPEPGRFHYQCRMGDSLRLKGFLVEPAEIEFRLAEHPGVSMAKVVGVPLAGETVAVGFVVAADGAHPDPEELRTWCAESLARFKVPQQVHVLNEMPMTVGTNGMKVRAAALREMATGMVRQEVKA